MKLSVFVTTFSLLFIEVNSYPFGAPACVSKPRHGVDPIEDLNALNISIQKTVQNGSVILSFKSNSPEDYFRGFLVRTKSAGMFLTDDDVAKVECTGFLGSSGPDTKAVSHKDSSNKMSARIQFMLDTGTLVEPNFDVILLKNFSTFCTDIKL